MGTETSDPEFSFRRAHVSDIVLNECCLLEDRLRQHGMNTFRLIDKLRYV